MMGICKALCKTTQQRCKRFTTNVGRIEASWSETARTSASDPLFTLQDDYCCLHIYTEKIKMLKKELAVVHKKIQSYSEKLKNAESRLNIIDKTDYFKRKLYDLDPNRSHFKVLRDFRFKRDIERMFGMSYNESVDYFENLVKERNKIVHRYTINDLGFNFSKF